MFKNLTSIGLIISDINCVISELEVLFKIQFRQKIKNENARKFLNSYALK